MSGRAGHTEAAPSGRDILVLIAPTCLWAAHFVALYALISAACAPRGLLSESAADLWGAVATAVALAGALLPLRRLARGDALGRATAAVAFIASLAILTDASILLVFESCGG